MSSRRQWAPTSDRINETTGSAKTTRHANETRRRPGRLLDPLVTLSMFDGRDNLRNGGDFGLEASRSIHDLDPGISTQLEVNGQ
jgi:hypothetical protein